MLKFEQLDPTVQALLWHHPWDETPDTCQKLLDPETGPYYYFRRSKSNLHERLTQLMDHREIPNVLIHGSPHVDNYAKTLTGAGLVDFDRAYVGPYVWDIICLMLSISLRNPEQHYQPLSKELAQSIRQSYLRHFKAPEEDYQPFTPLEQITPKDWELEPDSYLRRGKKWALAMGQQQLAPNDPIAKALLTDFIQHSAHQENYKPYQITQVSQACGSFGRKRYLFVLKRPDQHLPLLVDIKQTKDYLKTPWGYANWYHNPYRHEGKRLCMATLCYAPSFSPGESYATLNGIEYWGRVIPTLNRKPEKTFNEEEQLQFAKAGASQLGRGHRLSLQEIEPSEFTHHFKHNYSQLLQILQQMRQEIFATWDAYCDHFRKLES